MPQILSDAIAAAATLANSAAQFRGVLPVGNDYCSQCKHGIGTAQRGAAEVADAPHVATARQMKADGHTARDVAKYLGVSRATLYRYLADEAA